MRKILCSFYGFACRMKFITSILAVSFGSALLTLSACAWYYTAITQDAVRSYERELSRLTTDLDMERLVNRTTLAQLADQIAKNAETLERVTAKADSAATTAKSAATTAKSTAKSIDRSYIDLQKVRGSPPLKGTLK